MQLGDGRVLESELGILKETRLKGQGSHRQLEMMMNTMMIKLEMGGLRLRF